MEKGTVKINVDGKVFDVKSDKNLLHTCLALGFNVPHFCYHPALGSVGACRLCAVKKYKDENDTKGRIVMSCMEPVTEGLRISIEDEEVRVFRKAIIESLMINHPHDCPVCDEGGECHLQDMTVMTGHNYRRFNFRKRTYKNQNLGPFINHEMNRCIQCYRCVRYYKDYAGGNDLSVFGSRDHLYFGRFEEGALECEFSGNLVEVCPTGVFTDKTLKQHYARKWDMTNTPSICANCSVGCNTIVGERYDKITRIMSRYNGSVNGYFICDRGRFGYEFVNDEERIRNVYSRKGKNADLEITNEEEFKITIKSLFSEKKKVIGIGSPRASLESNYALSQLVGKDNYYNGISQKDHILINQALKILADGSVNSPSLKEIEKADAIFILGEDLTNTAPMAALALRQASRNKSFAIAEKNGIPLWHDDAVRTKGDHIKTPLFIATAFDDKLDDIAEKIYRAAPQDIARLGFAVASCMDEKAPKVDDLGKEEMELAELIARELKQANHPLVISGVHSCSEDIIQASANIANALASAGKRANLSFIFPECNSMGTAMMGGKSLEDALETVQKGEVETVIVLENNLYLRANSAEIDLLFAKCKNVIVLDHYPNETTLKADVLIPVGTFAESTGTIVNNEGRAQRFYTALPIKFPVLESWKWIKYVEAIIQNKEIAEQPDFESVVNSMTDSLPVLQRIKELTPENSILLNEKIARQTRRFSGRTAIRANVNVSEQAPAEDNDSQLAFTMEGGNGNPPSSLIPFYWSPGWNSVQALYKYTTEPLKGGDPGVRLLEADERNEIKYFDQIPPSFKPKADQLFIVPVHHIFGSEELSSKCNAIKQRIPKSTVYLNHSDAEKSGLKSGDMVSLDILKNEISLEVKISENQINGVAGVFVRLSDESFIDLPAWGKISKRSDL